MEYEHFLRTFIQNVDYINKDIALTHILNFLKNNTQFEPREAVRCTDEIMKKTQGPQLPSSNQQDSVNERLCLVKLGADYFQMYIGVPLSYPKSSPIFLIQVDRNNNIITDEERLVRQKYIFFEQNEKKEDFIRLKFPFLQQWNYQKDSILILFTRLLEMINRPPLIQSKFVSKVQRESRMQKNLPPAKSKVVVNNKLANQMISKLESDMTQILISKQNLEQFIQNEGYNQSREIFLADHLMLLKKKITTTRNLIIDQSNKIQARLAEVEKFNDCSSLFQINEGDNQKMEAIAQQQVLKEMEVKLRSIIEKGEGKKFSDFKKAMKIVYQKMFENQTKILKLSK